MSLNRLPDTKRFDYRNYLRLYEPTEQVLVPCGRTAEPKTTTLVAWQCQQLQIVILTNLDIGTDTKLRIHTVP